MAIVNRFSAVVAVEATANGDSFSPIAGVGLPWATVNSNHIVLTPGRYVIEPSGITLITIYTRAGFTKDGDYPAKTIILSPTVDKLVYMKGAGVMKITKL